jgi:hypothetical protein
VSGASSCPPQAAGLQCARCKSAPYAGCFTLQAHPSTSWGGAEDRRVQVSSVAHQQLARAARERRRGGRAAQLGQQARQPVRGLRRQQQPAPGRPRAHLRYRRSPLGRQARHARHAGRSRTGDRDTGVPSTAAPPRRGAPACRRCWAGRRQRPATACARACAHAPWLLSKRCGTVFSASVRPLAAQVGVRVAAPCS